MYVVSRNERNMRCVTLPCRDKVHKMTLDWLDVYSIVINPGKCFLVKEYLDGTLAITKDTTCLLMKEDLVHIVEYLFPQFTGRLSSIEDVYTTRRRL